MRDYGKLFVENILERVDVTNKIIYKKICDHCVFI